MLVAQFFKSYLTLSKNCPICLKPLRKDNTKAAIPPPILVK